MQLTFKKGRSIKFWM